jgi:type II secretory pathway pseudopilin PulG
MSPSDRTPRRLAPRSFPASRGFTLIELMIATVAAMLVTMAAFLLSRGASRFFQNEARISTAQLAVSIGMNRLVADIQRASFMSSPNISNDASSLPKDRAVCPPAGGFAPNFNTIAGIAITKGGSLSDAIVNRTSAVNGLNPDRIQIVGTFGTTEQFPVQAIVPGASGGTYNIFLQPNSAAYWRARGNVDAANAAGAGNDPLSLIFRTGRAIRIVDQAGNHEYGLITAFTPNNGAPFIAVGATPQLVQKTPNTSCGFVGFCVGCLVNPVARVQYDLRSLQALDPANPARAVYNDMLTAGQDPARNTVTADDLRTELVREEFSFDNNGAAILGTLEVVAEYAVDLKFGLTVINGQPGGNPGAGLNGGGAYVRYPIQIATGDTGDVARVAGPVTLATSQPERIRAVQVRLATRTRAPDRESDVPFFTGQAACNPGQLAASDGCQGADGRRTRFNVTDVAPGSFGSKTRYARVRTQYADVVLPNQLGLVW